MKKNKIIFPLILLGIFIFSLTTIYTGDDWGYLTLDTNKCFKYGLNLWTNYNGRILGNALICFLKTNTILKCCIISFSLTALIYIIKKYCKKESFLFILFLFICVPIGIFKEAYMWMSGFANFIIPTLGICLLLLYSKDIFDKKKLKLDNVKICIYSLIIGLISGLFAEHTSIFMVIFAVSLIIISLIFQKKIYIYQILFLIGSIISCTIMFASPVYHEVMPRLANSIYWYDYNIFEKGIYTLKNTSFICDLLFNNLFLNFFITSLFLYKYKDYNKLGKTLIIINFILSLTIFPLIYGYNKINLVINLFNKYLPFLSFLKNTIFKMSILLYFYISLLYLIIKGFKTNTRYKLIFTYVLGILAACPLLAAYDIGPRCFVNTYFIFIIFAIFLFEEINTTKKFNKTYKIILITYTILLSIMQFTNYYYFQKRNDYLKNNQDTKEITIYKYPFNFIIHQSGDPSDAYHTEVFIDYFHLQKDVIINKR